MTEHTPGPWIVDGDASVRVAGGHVVYAVAGNGCLIATLDSANSSRQTANARLIAAAPDLLEALEHMSQCRPCGEDPWEDCEGGRKALAAIAKARGQADE